MKEFNLISNIYCRLDVTVVAENREEAERILNDTIDSITVKEFKDKLSKSKQVNINDSKVVQQTYLKEKEMER